MRGSEVSDQYIRVSFEKPSFGFDRTAHLKTAAACCDDKNDCAPVIRFLNDGPSKTTHQLEEMQENLSPKQIARITDTVAKKLIQRRFKFFAKLFVFFIILNLLSQIPVPNILNKTEEVFAYVAVMVTPTKEAPPYTTEGVFSPFLLDGELSASKNWTRDAYQNLNVSNVPSFDYLFQTYRNTRLPLFLPRVSDNAPNPERLKNR